MIGVELLLLTVVSSCVLSLPVTSSQLENEDVEVMKCIVEALADVLSRPHLVPISQECLVTLKSDDRLITILRHHHFLRELQEIAAQGGQERAQLQRHDETPAPTTQSPHSADDNADRSMLEALGGAGERSILSETKRTGDSGRRQENGESREDGDLLGDSEAEEEQVKWGKDEGQGEAETTDKGSEEEEYTKRRPNSEESSEENETMDKKGDEPDEEGDASIKYSKQKKSDEEDEEEDNKRAAHFSPKHEGIKANEEEDGMKRGSREGLKRWAKRAQTLQLKKKGVEKEARQLSSSHEVPHHSKEAVEGKEERKKKKRVVLRSPEENELQMIARRAPGERRVMEEEGSASRKPEEPEIESLAAIESELENVAQKLHELRRG
ncbi:chromogranin-A [Menidia menidia]